MTVDSTFEFEKRRNRPIRYNRETMGQTLQTMKRVSEIQTRRSALYYKTRMQVHEGAKRAQIRKEIKQGMHLIAPSGANKEKAIANAVKRGQAARERILSTKRGAAQAQKIKN
jgi:large subunit ribosomal protein L24e|tara:strand:- start:26 stop:364 length:339 start_codon:yes stop_codon:yes gene_type:complete